MDHTPNTPQDVFSRETLIGLADGMTDWLFSSLRFDILITKKVSRVDHDHRYSLIFS